jgi:hypothetical protein
LEAVLPFFAAASAEEGWSPMPTAQTSKFVLLAATGLGQSDCRELGGSMRRIWYWLVRFGCWLVLDLRLYYLWSRFGQWLFERKYVGKAIRLYKDEEELQKVMDKWVWRRDPFWQFNDMISCAAKVEALADAGESVGDCDDFSIYAGRALENICEASGNTTIAGKLVNDISLLTVPWLEKNGVVGGHNVCVFRYLGSDGKWWWAWVSNWYDCRIQWEQPNGARFETAAQIAAYMSSQADAENLRWARVSLDLKKVFECGTALG